MSWEIATVTNPIARKDYHCKASDWIDDTIGWDAEEYDEEDRVILRNAIQENCKILKGTKYINVSGKWEGEFETFRARQDLDAICIKYGLYPDC